MAVVLPGKVRWKAFVVGQKLFGEVMLENRSNPLFSEFWPHFLDFMKKLKGLVKQ